MHSSIDRIRIALFGWVAAVLLVPGAALAERPDLPDSAKAIKNPVEWFDWGADFRVRNERFPDALDKDPTRPDAIREWYRFRTRIWGNFKPADDMKLALRFVNESRPIESPDHYVSANPHDSYDHFDEIIIDQLFFEWKSILDSPVSARLGRQDMMAIPGTTGPNGSGFGEGLIFMDGTPGDGSRTSFMDAARVTVDLSDWIENSSVDFLAIGNAVYTRHHWLYPIGGDDYRRLDDWSNELYGFYFKNASWVPRSQVDFYYLYKIEDTKSLESWESMPANKYLIYGTYVNTVGARLAGRITDYTRYAVEAAYQFGTWNRENRRGLAAEGSITQDFDVWLSPSLKAYGVYLSGDDPDTSKNEAWNQIYGRWPKWGELIGYGNVREDGIYNFNNMEIVGVQANVKPTKNTSLTGVLQWLWAPENTWEDSADIFGDGNYRGFNPQAIFDWSPTTYFSARLRGEYYVLGNYYAGPANDEELYFIQWEVLLKF